MSDLIVQEEWIDDREILFPNSEIWVHLESLFLISVLMLAAPMAERLVSAAK